MSEARGANPYHGAALDEMRRRMERRTQARQAELLARRHRSETRHVGIDTTHVKVSYALHNVCTRLIAKDQEPCGRCAWLSEIDTPDARYFDFWVNES